MSTDGTGLDQKEILEALKQEGLSAYAAETYLTLLEIGPADGRKLASSTRVPFSKIYSVLKELEENGLVTREGSRPATYRPVDPAEAFEMMKKRRIYEESARLDALARALSPMMAKHKDAETATVQVIRDQDAALERALRLIKDAKFGIKAIIPPVNDEQAKLIQLLMQSLVKTGLKLQLIVGGSSIKLLPKEKGIEVKTVSTVPLGLLLADSHSVMVLIYLGYLSTLFTESPPLIELTELVFEKLWEIGKDVAGAASPQRNQGVSFQLHRMASEPAGV